MTATQSLSRSKGRKAPQFTCESLEQRQVLSAPPFAAGHTIVQLTFAWSTPGGGNTSGNVWIELYDQETPNTVTNFLRYVDATDNHKYTNSFVHRHDENFVLQMGGYYLDPNNNFALEDMDRYDPVANEIPSGDPSTWPEYRKNVARTVAMAKTSDPDSATSEFFFNLKDNSSILDVPSNSGGFTVFGYVVEGWDVVQTITGLDIVDFTPGNQTAFNTVPVGASYVDNTNPTNNDLVVLTSVQRITNPGWSQEPAVNQIVTGAGKTDGETLFVTVNELGRAIAFHQQSPTSGWTVSDINIQSSGPTLVGRIYAWADTKDGLFYAAAPTASGLFLYQRSAEGFWSKRNLTTSIVGAETITSDITTFTTTDGNQFIAGLAASGHMVVYNQTAAAPVNGDYTWEFADLVTRDLAPNGQTMPQFVGSITSYVTSWNGLNIAGLDPNGDVQSIWWAPGIANDRWRTDNLSDLTGAQPFTGTLTPYVTTWGGVNLAGTDASGNVVVTWWVPGFDWQTTDLTALIGGPALQINSLTSFVTPWGGLNIGGLDAAGDLRVYWWAPGVTDWATTDSLVPSAVQPAARVNGFGSPNNVINLAARGTDGHAIRYFWDANNPSDPWASQDLSAIATFF